MFKLKYMLASLLINAFNLIKNYGATSNINIIIEIVLNYLKLLELLKLLKLLKLLILWIKAERNIKTLFKVGILMEQSFSCFSDDILSFR